MEDAITKNVATLHVQMESLINLLKKKRLITQKEYNAEYLEVINKYMEE